MFDINLKLKRIQNEKKIVNKVRTVTNQSDFNEDFSTESYICTVILCRMQCIFVVVIGDIGAVAVDSELASFQIIMLDK